MPRRQCRFPGCTTPTGQTLGGAALPWQGYCPKHFTAVRSCVIDGCLNKIASWNRSGCCHEHRAEGRKLRP